MITILECALGIIGIGVFVFGFIFLPDKADKHSKRFAALVSCAIIGTAFIYHGAHTFLTSLD